MAAEPKTGAFYLRMGQTEDRMLRELAERSGLNRADVIRQLIRREYAKVFEEEPRAKSRPRRK
jgi:hypothetical protein